MKHLGSVAVLVGAAAVVTLAWGGHELPVYPSFYPHEIEIRTIAPENAADALRAAKIQAYVGPGLSFSGVPPESIRAVESLGSFVMVHINPQSALAKDEASACALVKAVVRDLAGPDFVWHPYPVTPFHGDYLHHADLAEAAKARFSGAAGNAPVRGLKVRASGGLAQGHPDWSAPDADWDAEIVQVAAADLVASATYDMNGWIGPPWIKTGWFHAERLLADAPSDPAHKQRAELNLQRLMAGNFDGLVARINLERELVTSLTGGCRKVVAGYTVKREYFNAEFSVGIENIGYDSIEGLHSPMFLRTVKLKDFPWNGWLGLGIDAWPAAAWNPVGGMTDPFGRLMGFAAGDPALLPSPYGAGWMLNRIADLPSSQGR
jgi:hypothetical protein